MSAKKHFKVALALAGCVLCVGCSLVDRGESTRLIGDDWFLLSESRPDGSEPMTPPNEQVYSLRFANDGSVHGSADCNTCNGTYTTHQTGELTIGLGCTEIACGQTSWSDRFSDLVARADSFEITAAQLFLFTQNRAEEERLLTFERK